MKAASNKVKAYLSEVQANKTIVMPVKDRHHYSAALNKILNSHNVRRLGEKIVDKYLLGKHQEFGHIRSHVFRHAAMLLNSMRLIGKYTEMPKLGRFVYYPLHVPGDMALTLRSPQFLDQLGLIDYLLRNLPNGYKLAIKEHPAMVGAIDASRLKTLLNRYDQLALINPAENNFDVLDRCEAVVSVNSKSGAEAILLGKPVLVLGDAFYRNSPLATPVTSITEVGLRLRDLLAETFTSDRGKLERYFEEVWRCTYPGELYVQGEDNTKVFAHSIMSAVLDADPRRQLEVS